MLLTTLHLAICSYDVVLRFIKGHPQIFCLHSSQASVPHVYPSMSELTPVWRMLVLGVCWSCWCMLVLGVCWSWVYVGLGCMLVLGVCWSWVYVGLGCMLVLGVCWSWVYVGLGCMLVLWVYAGLKFTL